MSNLTTRTLVALIGIPLIVGVTLAGGVPFFLLVAVIAMVCLGEFHRLAAARGLHPQRGVAMVFGLLVLGVFFYREVWRVAVGVLSVFGVAVATPTMAQTLLIVMVVFGVVVTCVELFGSRGLAMVNAGVTMFGVVYVPMFLGTLVGLRELFVPGDFPVYAHFNIHGLNVPDDIARVVYTWGGWTVVTVFASIWLCDSAAYFVGTAWGRHKLFEAVSPNKTWEGAIAGLVTAVAAFVVAGEALLPYLSLQEAVVCGIIVGIFGQVGDMVESKLKRDAGVKDSSALIPGHGGMLDRFDSLILVSPVLFLYMDFVVF